MQLESLQINRMGWGKNEGMLEGHIVFKNRNGEVKLLLNDEVSNRLLAIVAEGVVESSKMIANDLPAAVITANPALENKAPV